MKNDVVYIYGLVDPRDDEIYYIGKAENPELRLKQHMNDTSVSNKVLWLKELSDNGFNPRLEILDIVAESDWVKAEKYWIKYGYDNGYPLTNISNGGGFSKNHKVNSMIETCFYLGYTQGLEKQFVLAMDIQDKWEFVYSAAKSMLPEIESHINRFLETQERIELLENVLLHE